MSENLHPMGTMGTPQWAEQVFSSPPVRKLKGHSLRTQYHQFLSTHLNQMVGVQGRNELCTALAIEYLISNGHLHRAKPQPFVTPKEFGAEICPDFLVENATSESPSYFVIETKSKRFLTRVKQLELDHYREQFASFGIKYLVWTDQTPLNHSVRHHLINMRVGANRDVTPVERENLVTWVKSQFSPRIENFFYAGFDLDCLYAAAWHCELFFPITRPFAANTLLTCYPQVDLKAIFLNCTNSVDEWWIQLPSC